MQLDMKETQSTESMKTIPVVRSNRKANKQHWKSLIKALQLCQRGFIHDTRFAHYCAVTALRILERFCSGIDGRKKKNGNRVSSDMQSNKPEPYKSKLYKPESIDFERLEAELTGNCRYLRKHCPSLSSLQLSQMLQVIFRILQLVKILSARDVGYCALSNHYRTTDKLLSSWGL